jgi:hypothetical protein
MNTLTLLGWIIYSSAPLIVTPQEPDWSPVWPLFENSPYFNDRCAVGWGDRAANGNHYAHNGLDFWDPNQGSIPADSVLAPRDDDSGRRWVSSDDPASCGVGQGWAVLFGKTPNDLYGWCYYHLDLLDADDWQRRFETDPLRPHEPLAPCIEYEEPGMKHVMLTWAKTWYDERDPTQDYYWNPFEYFDPTVEQQYDTTYFRPVPYAERDLSTYNHGIIFLHDGSEDWTNLAAFQSYVYGAVDAAVSPYSAFLGNPSSDSCGVKEVSYSLIWQDPYYGSWASVYGPRTLVRMCGEVPKSSSSEFEAVFLDPNSLYLNWVFHSTYIITNCGTSAIGSTGWENVVTDSCHSDIDDGEFSLGGWDTRVRDDQEHPMAQVNAHALYPDGRYGFEVTAQSQAEELSSTVSLPSQGASQDLPCLGVVLDNFLPHVAEVRVYEFSGGDGFLSNCDGAWVADSYEPLENPRTRVWGESWEYLDFTCEGIGLGVAVGFSEVMDSTALGEVSLAAVSGLDTLWQSGPLEPAPWRSKLGPRPETPNEFWQCYEATAPNYLERYSGRIVVKIGQDEFGTYPSDLNGNPIDSNPQTVAQPRDPDTGYSSSENCETGSDRTTVWGHPTWWITDTWPNNRYVHGSVGPDGPLVVTVDMSLLGNPDYNSFAPPVGTEPSNRGRCTYPAGFWLQGYSYMSSCGYIYSVRPTGSSPYWYEQKTDIPGWIAPARSAAYPCSQTLSVRSAASGGYLFYVWNDFSAAGEPGSGRAACINDRLEWGSTVSYECPIYTGPPDEFYTYGDSICLSLNEDHSDWFFLSPDDFGFSEGDGNSLSRIAGGTESNPSEQGNFVVGVSRNPASGSILFSVEGMGQGCCSANVYDLSGRMIWSQTVTSLDAGSIISTSEMPNGLYILEVCNDRQILTQKVTVIR